MLTSRVPMITPIIEETINNPSINKLVPELSGSHNNIPNFKQRTWKEREKEELLDNVENGYGIIKDTTAIVDKVTEHNHNYDK